MDSSELSEDVRQNINEVTEKLTAEIPWDSGDVGIFCNTRRYTANAASQMRVALYPYKDVPSRRLVISKLDRCTTGYILLKAQYVLVSTPLRRR